MILLAVIALQVNVGVNQGGDGLLLSDEEELELSLAETLFQLNESKLRGELAVDPEGLDEVLNITIGVGSHEVFPSLISVVGGRKAIRVDLVLLGTGGSVVTSARAALADSFGALRGAVTFETAGTAGASKGTLNLGVGTLGLVVSDFTTVEALASHLTRFSAVAREVSGLAAAEMLSAEFGRWTGTNDLLAAGIVTSVVLRDHLRINARVFSVSSSSSGALDPSCGVHGGRLIPTGS